MSGQLFKQFELARSWSIEVSESISREIVNLKPRGFNNTIKWQIGHILTSTEYFLFVIQGHANHLPVNYTDLFGSNTKPDDWTFDVPTVDLLIEQLKEQLVRMRNIPPIKLNKTLVKPIHRFETFADCAGFSVLHEVLHVGKIEEMQRVILDSGDYN